MERLKVGVIGKGFIGPAHIEALMRLGTIEVVALAGTDEVESKVKAEQLGIRESYGNYKKLLENKELEVIHICSPNNLHFPMVKEALAAGKHVVCEKPLAISVEEGQALLELADKKGLVHAVHFNIRYYPLMRQLKMMVDKGEFGEIFAIHGSYLQDWLFYPSDYNWRLDPELSGKSRAVADIGSHWIDLIEYVSGLRINEVFADFATFHKTRKKPLKPLETYAGKLLKPEDYQDINIDTEDYATVLFRFKNEAKGVMTVNQVAAGRKNRLYFEMDGSKKSAAWDSEAPNQMWIGRRDGNNEILMKDPALVYPECTNLIDYPGGHNEGFPDTLKQIFKEIYSYIRDSNRNSTPPFPTFKDGLRELVLGEKILESSDSEKWVKI
ncbi:MAG TPA: Gfo/Idh/MocA family oxidoreductase [Spirochaetales bacterium]|nr:Gfo/Idh/MocA family oxidoreductase [Spirochaetales bacterium]